MSLSEPDPNPNREAIVREERKEKAPEATREKEVKIRGSKIRKAKQENKGTNKNTGEESNSGRNYWGAARNITWGKHRKNWQDNQWQENQWYEYHAKPRGKNGKEGQNNEY